MQKTLTRSGRIGAAVLAVGFIAGCAAPMQSSTPAASPGYGGYGSASSGASTQYGVQYGQVQSIEVVRAEQASSTGGGAVLGAVIGGVLGNQVGSGTGRAAATGAGVVGGALIGDRIEKSRQPAAGETVRVLVRFDNGSTRYFDYAQAVDLRVGDRVRVENDRVTRY